MNIYQLKCESISYNYTRRICLFLKMPPRIIVLLKASNEDQGKIIRDIIIITMMVKQIQ